LNAKKESNVIDISEDIESLTSFKRDSDRLMKQMKSTGRPVVLTVNGKAQAVLMNPKAYQQMADRLSTLESIARGLAQAKRGEFMTVDECFDQLEAEDVAAGSLIKTKKARKAR